MLWNSPCVVPSGYFLPSLTASWSQDVEAPVPAFVDTGATLIDKSNVDGFMQARNAPTAGVPAELDESPAKASAAASLLQTLAS